LHYVVILLQLPEFIANSLSDSNSISRNNSRFALCRHFTTNTRIHSKFSCRFKAGTIGTNYVTKEKGQSILVVVVNYVIMHIGYYEIYKLYSKTVTRKRAVNKLTSQVNLSRIISIKLNSNIWKRLGKRNLLNIYEHLDQFNSPSLWFICANLYTR